MTTAAHSFGLRSSCSPEEFEREIANLYASCTLEGVGDFYFAIEEDSRFVYLKFYDAQKQILHKSSVHLFSLSGTSTSTRQEVKAYALNKTTFLVGTSKWTGLCTLSVQWSTCIYTTVDSKKVPVGLRVLRNGSKHSEQTSISKSGLSRIRNGTPGDFTLKSADGESISVHKVVMKPLWPFLAAAMDSMMVESTEDSIDLPFPTSTIEVAVSYLYGQKLSIKFKDAANLVVMAQMYDLPELLEIAVRNVKDTSMDIRQSLYLWKRAFEAKNDDLRDYSAGAVKILMPDMSKSELLDDLDKEELVALFVDVSSQS
ncbi:hypothetical protein CJU89_5853 [Yarrowia sp. B02]|nr:hypothetical protein CJU89_5853 [Yarrowia sp. B02]